MSNDCAVVIDLWTHFGKTTTLDRNNATGCCSTSDTKPDIPHVVCNPFGKVSRIGWDNQSLTGSIPDYIGNLKSLEFL
jgi:hypothetical protein